MADLVTLTVNGQPLRAAKGTLLIDAAKQAGINIPAFCYYEGLSLQAACRMCLVEVEKTPKLQAACTLPVAEGMVVRTESEQVVKARKTTLEFLLANHPLDCPVCDKGGECELQDMVFRYGAGESRYTEVKHHVDEQQWSPVVYYDGPRCILCYRCVRVCDEGMGVGALGVTNRGASSLIVPNKGDHLDCDECGACIDICPVGALTSGTYRYQTRPWEMEHVGTVCTHCGDGCKTTLGVRNGEIVRGNNRDRSGINGDFLCVKGRYGFDFSSHPERLQSPLMRINGQLQEVSWSAALVAIGQKMPAIKAAGGKIGVVGSSLSTNEENYYLQKFARQGLGTAHIDHQRSGDVAGLIDALAGRTNALATTDELYTAKAVVVIGADLSQQHPFLAYQIRANCRHHQAAVYTITSGPVRETSIAKKAVLAPSESATLSQLRSLAEDLKQHAEVVIVFGDIIKGSLVRELVEFGNSLGVKVKYVCLVDYVNSRGAVDMGVDPRLLPGFKPAPTAGMTLPEMIASPDLAAFWVVGSNPLEKQGLASSNAFIVVQDMFLTETAKRADIVLPSASLYEKNGTVTNGTGQVQRLKKAASVMGAKTDLDILGLAARAIKLDGLGAANAEKIFDEIRSSVRGYNVPLPVIATGGAPLTAPLNGRVDVQPQPELIRSAQDTLFTSGTLGRYSKMLNSVMEAPGKLYGK
ncbi:MAG: NADH-quinone oxidoreductase subunit NuoG [Acidobacteria bacterium]|nr:NADH-quinone oxidoreductase subunit NuoG [Acidobacteriota bacterium]